MDRTVIYALVVGAILIVAFFALWRGTDGADVATPTTNTPAGTSTGSGTGTGGTPQTRPTTPSTPTTPPAK